MPISIEFAVSFRGVIVKPVIVLGSDHAGYQMKMFLIKELEQNGYQIEDRGPFCKDPVNSGTYAIAVAEEVAAHPKEKLGILICGTGIGMSMMANKVLGIRASLVSDLFSAKMTRAHNAANILCLGARVIAEAMAWEITKIWLNTEPLGGKYADRVAYMMEYEKVRCKRG